jgi:hypothetical protein
LLKQIVKRSDRYRKRDAVTSSVDVLRLIFRVARKESGVHGCTTLANVFEDRIIRCGSPISPTALGMESVTELAALFVRDIGAMRIRAQTFEDFTSRNCVRGYQSRIRGKLWHLFVRNFQPLDDDFRANALSQLEELNDPKVAASILRINPATKPPDLINGKEEVVKVARKFGRPRKAHTVRIIKSGGKAVEFIDELYVSYAGSGVDRFWALLNEVEIKTAGAARGFRKQIGFSQFRVGADGVREVEMTVEGFKRPVRVAPERLIFSTRATVRNAVTLLGNKQWALLPEEQQRRCTELLRTGDQVGLYVHSDFQYQSTSRGYGESFCVVTLPIPVSYFDALVAAIWPRLSE